MSENLCRWCGCAMNEDDRGSLTDDTHLDAMICQALLLRKLVDILDFERNRGILDGHLVSTLQDEAIFRGVSFEGGPRP